MKAVGRRSLAGAILASLRSASALLGGRSADTSAEAARQRLTQVVGSPPPEDEAGRSAPDRHPPASGSPLARAVPYQRMAEAMSDGIVLHDAAGRALYVSPSLGRLAGLEAGGAAFRERIHSDDRAAFGDMLAALATPRATVVLTLRIRHADGRWARVETVNDHVPANDGCDAGIVSVLRDVTDRHDQADDLRMARDAAELAQARAESTARAKSEFIGLMSHEIRTPLTTIRGFIDLLVDGGPLSAQQRRHLSLVEASAETLLVTVDDILDYARSETGDLRIEARSFALSPLVGTVADLVRQAAEAKGVALDVSLGRDLPAYVVGDERRLRQILLNLLNDAVGTARAGAVTLSVVGPRLGQATGTLRFSIITVVPDDLPPIAIPRAASLDGSGLGLTVAQRLIGLMGGRIDRSTRPGEAAAYRFPVVLPAARESSPSDLDPAPATRAARILVAEDNVIDQEIARAMLERAGYAVDIVGDGKAALEAVQVRTYDLVLMDMMMPVMDGLSAARRIRALQHPSRRVPIVAMSSDLMPDRVRAFTEAGISAHLAKPFDRRSLDAAVSRQLSAVVLIDADETGSRPTRPAVFDRSCYDGLRAELGSQAALNTLRAFIALLEGCGGDDLEAHDAETVAIGAVRLGFLDVSNAYGRLAAAPTGPDRVAALRRCRVARDLAQRTFQELTSDDLAWHQPGRTDRPELSQHVALL